MFFKNRLWNDFKGEVLESLRYGFASGKTIVPLKIEGLNYAFDFVRMLQVHIQTKNHRSIAWVDENCKPFFPGKFIDCDFSKVAQTNDADRNAKKKLHSDNDDDDDDVVIIGVKHESKFPNTRLLSKTEKTYLYIKSLFMNNVGHIDPNACIISIHDLHYSSPIARARWSVFEKQVEITEAARGNANVVYSWYAAPAEKVVSIFRNGFKLIRNYPQVRPSIGAGIFLANLESPQHSGMQHQVEKDEEKYLVLCRIVLGRMERVDLETHQTHLSNNDYDTGCDDPKNPHWYVVWGNDMNKRVLPVCVITCKTSVIKDVKWEMTPVEMTMVPRFYLEMKKRVPIEFISPLQDIYDIYKKDGMNMGVFKKHVKALLGEQKMAQIFKDIYDGEI
ncbi:unnamed protein product [Vicia faba]|uniref:Poly [ADP-ribose] polymerase n=1 Tax=Vicia faba TaxID=3906 RepID=A0AAV0ZQH6_VICFA|nr:unnamed protein product [Vicia faba]